MGPPLIARALLRLLLPADVRDSVDGDLVELHAARTHSRGRMPAALWYWRQTLSFISRFALDRIRRSARAVASIGAVGSPDARRERAIGWLESVRADIHFGRRAFARRPLSSTTIVLVLAIGIAGCATVYGLLQSAIMRPPQGVPSDASLVLVRRMARANDQPVWSRARFSYSTLREMSTQRGIFTAVAGWTDSRVTIGVAGLLDGGTARAQFVTDGYFSVVGVRPVHGSSLPALSPNAPMEPQLVAVISESMWEDVFARQDPTQRRLMVNGVAVRIVGVAPPAFGGVTPDPDDGRLMLWLPLSTRATILAARPGANASGGAALSSVDSMLFHVVGRIAPGVSTERATAAVRVISANAARQMAPPRAIGSSAMKPPAVVYDADVVSLQGSSDALQMALGIPPGPGLTWLLTLFGSLATLLLLVVCTNVGALAVSASVERRAEIAVRLSLGASRARVVRQLLTENVILGACGGVLGLATLWGVTIALRRVPTVAFFRPDIGTVAFTMILAVGTGILCGLAPALNATRNGVAAALKDTSSGVSRRSRLHHTFVIGQVAFTQPLLMVVGMFIGAAMLETKQPLLDAVSERVLRLRVDMASIRGSSMDKARAADRLDLRISQTPGVMAVLAEPEPIGVVPLGVRPEDRGATPDAGDPVTAQMRATMPGYFELIGVPLLRGTDIASSSDTSAGVIIGSDLARRLWGATDPIGRRFEELSQAVSSSRGGRRDLIVTGVYDSRYFDRGRPVLVFRPVAKLQSGAYLIRTTAPASSLVDSARDIVREELPSASITSLVTMKQFESEASQNMRALNAGLTACAALVLLLSSIGLYGSVALGVRQRRREIGVRMALGARTEQVVALFFGNGLRLGVTGLILGLPVSVGASNLLEHGVATDHAIVGGVIALVVLVVAAVATFIPAIRAARVNPVISLRSE
jgi:predicted permease